MKIILTVFITFFLSLSASAQSIANVLETRQCCGCTDAPDPLYILNGKPVKLDSSRQREVLVFIVETRKGVKKITVPYDEIESINVLKDADATAIYGTRGRLGVIEIKTKKNKKKRL